MAGLLLLLEERASMENPATPLSAGGAWWEGLFGVTTTASGVKVSRQKALTYAAVFGASNLISTYIGKIPVILYERLPDDRGKRRAPEHPAFMLMRHTPNSEMNAMTFKQTLQHHIDLNGNGYAYIKRDGAARPVELWPLSPEATWPVRVNGNLWYVTTVNGEERKIPAQDMLHIPGLGFDGLVGYSVLTMAAESLGMGIAAREYGARFFSNDARAGVVLEHPAKLSKDAADRIIASWNSMHAGLENKHKTAVLEEGMKANVISASGRDSQLVEQRAFEIREVANWFNVPSHKIGDTTKTAFASLEQENQAFLDDCLDGRMVRWEMACRDKLLTEEEKREDTHFFEFKREALLRANLQARAEYYTRAGGARPWMTPNEIRVVENMDALDDEDSDKLLTPLNIKAPEQPAQPPAAPGPPPPPPLETPTDEEEDGREALLPSLRGMLDDAMRRMVTRVGVHARKAAKKSDTFDSWLGAFAGEHGATIDSALTPPLAAIRLLDPEAPEPTALRERICRTIAADLEAVYSFAKKGEFAARVDAVMTELEADISKSPNWKE